MSRPASPGAEAKNISLRFAQSVDVEPLARLINAAFIVEQPFIEGDRIDPRGVRAYLEKGKFLVAEDSHGLAGCVYLELRGERGYLGLLGVEPRRQGTGLCVFGLHVRVRARICKLSNFAKPHQQDT